VASPFLTKVASLSGVGGIREAALRARGIESVLDLLLLVPTRYRVVPPPSRRADLAEGLTVSVTGRVLSARRARQRRGGTFLDLSIDVEGPLRVCFYNRGWLKDQVGHGDRVLLTGRVGEGGAMIAGADLWRVESDEDLARLLRLVLPVHPAVPKVAEGTLRRLVRQALDLVAAAPDPLAEPLRTRLGLAPLHESLRRIHEPCAGETLEPAAARLVFDRLLSQALVARAASHAAAGPAPALETPPPVRERIRGRIPFQLTPGQSGALDEILADLAKPVAMRRLLLGDVGSGKTAVAAGAMLAAVAAGYQGLLVAPTDVLAAQHHATLSGWLADSRVRIALLSGRVPKAEAGRIRRALGRGAVDVVVGTHAALAAAVAFPRLGLVVFDEQHRFGVMQRISGRNKAKRPHLLALSATPIPRSLCLALFGELAITRLAGRPGACPVPATRVCDAPTAYGALREAVARGERAFVVFPSIEGSTAPGVEREGRALVSPKGPLAGLEAGFLHGGMPVERQAEVLAAFRSGAVPILVSTVIVEVGLDVPEATVIVVEGADRFGLASLHQLRGRVGRGARPGHAYLVPSRGTPAAEGARSLERARLLERETDGFKIAEADLLLRGPGDWCGVRQHGFGGPLPIGAGADGKLVASVEVAAEAILGAGYDPSASTYFAALGRAMTARFDPKDAV
jgi:ATP-dependent DNA helicase RecG